MKLLRLRVLIGLLFAVAMVSACQQKGPVVEREHEAIDEEVAEGRQVDEAMMGHLSQSNLEEIKQNFELELKKEGPTVQELANHFYEIRAKDFPACAEKRPPCGEFTVSRAYDWLLERFESSKNEFSEEQSCKTLYLVSSEIYDYKDFLYFFCKKDDLQFALLSTYERDDDGWKRIK